MFFRVLFLLDALFGPLLAPVAPRLLGAGRPLPPAVGLLLLLLPVLGLCLVLLVFAPFLLTLPFLVLLPRVDVREAGFLSSPERLDL